MKLLSFSFGYLIVFEGKYSGTVGKRLLKLYIVDVSGIKITWQQAILRNLTKPGISSGFFIIEILIGIYLEKQYPKKALKQRGSDVLAETMVVKMN